MIGITDRLCLEIRFDSLVHNQLISTFFILDLDFFINIIFKVLFLIIFKVLILIYFHILILIQNIFVNLFLICDFLLVNFDFIILIDLINFIKLLIMTRYFTFLVFILVFY